MLHRYCNNMHKVVYFLYIYTKNIGDEINLTILRNSKEYKKENEIGKLNNGDTVTVTSASKCDDLFKIDDILEKVNVSYPNTNKKSIASTMANDTFDRFEVFEN